MHDIPAHVSVQEQQQRQELIQQIQQRAQEEQEALQTASGSRSDLDVSGEEAYLRRGRCALLLVQGMEVSESVMCLTACLLTHRMHAQQLAASPACLRPYIKTLYESADMMNCISDF